MTASGSAGDIRDWKVRDQIKADLKKQLKTLPLSQVHQLLILSSFATLRLKGMSRISASLEIVRQWQDGKGTYFARCICAWARHYQVFEQLPHEKRGGGQNARSFLHDESVQNHCCAWLSSLTAGKVTPHALQCTLNTTIFPQLGITPKRPISERTARQWLIKLGWRRTVVRKESIWMGMSEIRLVTSLLWTNMVIGGMCR